MPSHSLTPKKGRAHLALLSLCTLLLLVVASALLAPQARASTPDLSSASPQKDACSLLDNANARATMSGMLETKLLVQCGRTSELGGVGNEVGGPSTPLLGTDVMVSDPTGETGASTTQSETSMAIDDNTGTICSAYNDSYHGVTQGQGYTGYSRSTDGGASFQDQGALSSASFGDPSLVWRRVDGYFYMATLHSSGSLGLWRSTDQCDSFQFLALATSGSIDDKELMAVDNTPSSPHYGRFYMVWTDFGAGGRIAATHSDNGTSWTNAIYLTASGVTVQGAWPTVAPNGDVYAAWVRWDPYYTGPITIEAVRSTNGGTSYVSITPPMAGEVNPYEQGPTSFCGRPALNGNIRYLPSPQIQAGPSGDLHVAYVYDPDGRNAGDVIDVFYRRSTDNGATWGPEVQLNDDGTLTDQFFPTVSVGPTGNVVSTWYDRRLDPGGNYLFDYYMRVSFDNGVTWQPSVRVSDESSPVYLDPNLAACYHGDYDQQTQDDTYVYIQWSDDRRVQSGHQDPDIWFDKDPFFPDFTIDVSPASLQVCAPDDATYLVEIGQVLNYNDPVTLSVDGEPVGTSVTFSNNPVTPPGSSTLTIGNTDNAAAGSYLIDVIGVAATSTHTATVELELFTDIPVSPVLVEPSNGASDVGTTPTFTWGAALNAISYTFELATDPAFNNIIESASGLTDTSYTVSNSLDPNSTYYWRVYAMNVCGSSVASEVFSFTTGNIICETIPSNDVPKPIGPNGGTNTLSELFVTGQGSVEDVNVVNLAGTHTWISDLSFYLESPAGTEIQLRGQTCGSEDNFDINYDDEAAPGAPPCPPTDGNSYQPVEPLSTFDGQEVNGTWTLRILDNANGDGGQLQTWGLELCYVGQSGGGDPDIEVSPNSLDSTQPPDTTRDETLTIANVGSGPLHWTIAEVPGGPQPHAPEALGSGTPSAAAETVGASSPLAPLAPTGPITRFVPQEVLYSNGPLITCEGCGAGGADASEVQTALAMSLYGFGHQATAGNRVADEFTVDDPDGWQVDAFTFFAYQTGSSTTSTITAVNYRIWDGPPDDPASLVIFGDTSTNRLIDSTWSGIYRVLDTTLTDTQRPIMANTVSAGIALPAGTYWLDWQTDGTLASGPWAPPISIEGETTTGNGLQYTGAWAPAVDSGTNTQQGFPFIVEGTPSGGGGKGCDLPTDIPWLTVTPDNGTTNAGGSDDVTVVFDSNGLNPGVYEGTLCVGSDDPDEPLVEVPVMLTVAEAGEPDILVEPDSLMQTVPPDGAATEALTISNVGGGVLTWDIFESEATAPLGGWMDDFDSYATGSQMHGQGGWKGWFNDPNVGALVVDDEARSAPNSVEIVGASDLVHEYVGYSSGVWTYTAWQYLPTNFSGESYFILLNQYDDSGATNNWSTQVRFNAALNQVTADGAGAGPSLPLIRDQWVEIRVVIDLDNDNQAFYYGDNLLYEASWTDGLSGGGRLNIAAVDLYANGASAVYYDDLSLLPADGAAACDVPSDVPWLEVSPTSGSTAGGTSSEVTVLFDASGLGVGTYDANLCVTSNDADEELTVVPVTLVVEPFTAITVDQLAAQPRGLGFGLALAITGVALVLGAGIVRRQRQR